jgi:hypothetical protein
MSVIIKTKSKWRVLRRLLTGLAIFTTLAAIFYTEEDWRGKRAWENCKRELEAKGAVLDWNAYIPPPVPDDQNFFTTSTNFYLRFVKLQTDEQGEAAQRLQWLRLLDASKSGAVVVAEVTVISSNTSVTPDGADLYLHYNHSVLTVATSRDHFSEPLSPLLPVFDLKDVPLKNAIEQLAQAANLNCTIDAKVNSVDSKGKQILLNVRWENVTARQALFALLDNFNLVLLEDSKSGTCRILPKNGQVYVEPYATKKISDAISGVLEQSTNGLQGDVLQGATGVAFFSKSIGAAKPAHIVVLANEIPSAGEMGEMFLKKGVKSNGTNSFQISANPSVLSAEDYLAWSDQFVPAFDEIREALKRPYAIIPGDYSQPYAMPIPNFVTIRALAQMLAQRAQCDFLLGRSADALHELTLIHDMCRILERPPFGKPITLVEAMINVAVTALYTSAVADGLRLHVWQEPQLISLQAQLQEVKLPQFVVAGFQFEPAAVCEDFRPERAANLFKIYSRTKTTWKDFMQPMYWLPHFAPRGWLYQNMVYVALLDHDCLSGIDLAGDTFSPRELMKANSEVLSIVENTWSPYRMLAAGAIPSFTKAWQVTAHNQTQANEAQIACALERYHLAHGEYPETLDALAPQFIEKIPHDIIGGQPLHYRRTDDGKFLLYSVGWNETDDGGLPGTLSDVKTGDWVWQYPVKY